MYWTFRVNLGWDLTVLLLNEAHLLAVLQILSLKYSKLTLNVKLHFMTLISLASWGGWSFQVGFEMIDSIAQAQGILMNTIQSKALIGIGWPFFPFYVIELSSHLLVDLKFIEFLEWSVQVQSEKYQFCWQSLRLTWTSVENRFVYSSLFFFCSINVVYRSSRMMVCLFP